MYVRLQSFFSAFLATLGGCICLRKGCLSIAISAASYRGAKCPTLKTAEKGAEWVTVKQPKNSRKNTRNTRKTVKTAVLTVLRVFRVFFRLFFGCFTVTHSAPVSAVFRLFSMSGIWHLCSWPQRLQCLRSIVGALSCERPDPIQNPKSWNCRQSIFWPFFTQISGRNFLPELCGEVHPETAPLQAACCALCSTEQSTFWGPRKSEEEGCPAKGAKRKKDAWRQVSFEVLGPPRTWAPKVSFKWSKKRPKVHLDAPNQHSSGYSIDFFQAIFCGAERMAFFRLWNALFEPLMPILTSLT